MKQIWAFGPCLSAVSVCGVIASGCTQDSGVKVYNTAPSISITAPLSGSELSEDEVLTLEAFAGDDATSAEDLLVDFASDLDGTLSETLSPDSDGVVVFHTANLSPGEHVVTANVFDSAAASGSDYITLVITEVPDLPLIEVVHPIPGEYGLESEPYEFVALVSDEQDEPRDLLVRIFSDLEGSTAVCESFADATGAAACEATLVSGQHFITFEVEDLDGWTNSATVYFEVREGALIDDDGDGQTEAGGDCDDTDPSVYDGAEEFQNGIDDDCDGEIDEGTYAYDDDGDCHCEVAPCQGSIEPACVNLVGGDCDDATETTFPVAQELCDLVDNDCDGQIDEDGAADAPEWFLDLDGDGYGDANNGHVSCTAPFGHVSDDTDCDDSQPTVNPAGNEVCNSLDDDCDGLVDEGVQTTYWLDADGDGHGNPVRPFDACSVPSGYSSLDDDCDDSDAAISPTATEYCNGLDDDCDSAVDESDAADATTWYGDVDGDGYGNVLNMQVSCTAPSGFLTDSSDCNDADSAIHPAAIEVCDGADNNCDGLTDDASAVDAYTWYADSDADGFGNPNDTQVACWQAPGYLLNASDCDDADSGIYPGANEVCNGSDDDCDGLIDDGVGATYYQDFDGDGFGNATSTQVACSQPTGFVTNALDCNDSNGLISPAAAEVCDQVDNDCDGLTDDADSPVLGVTAWYLDSDGDGQGTTAAILQRCAQPGGYSANALDCNDSSAAAYQGATEVCGDSIDNDCDGQTDENCTSTVNVSSSPYAPIYDYHTTVDTLTVTGCNTVTDVQVPVHINHTYQGDLLIDVRSPTGTTVRLWNGAGGTTNNIIGTFGAGLYPYQALSGFNGVSGNGTWTMTIYDRYGIDSGTLVSWGVNLTCN